MLLNSRGFTLVEVILASSMIMVIIMTIVPMGSLLEREKAVLSERRILSLKLHDELQPFLWNDQPLPARYSSKFNLIDVHFRFTFDGDYVKGCVSWKNARGKSETICLYGYK